MLSGHAHLFFQTVFYFDVKKEHFHESLDKFAQFFIQPLMKQDSVDREIKAVDSGLCQMIVYNIIINSQEFHW